jgi:catechol 2,3-dioxygenase-like lactoylglutathione lyase family enzyme
VTQPFIAGIQQIGVGVADAPGAFAWYRRHFGLDIPVFDDIAEARLMARYTGGEVRQRHAILAINLAGGGGLEIWQYTRRRPRGASATAQLGDPGLLCARLKSPDIRAAYAFFRAHKVRLLGGIRHSPSGAPHFFLFDPYGNLFQVIACTERFGRSKHPMAGICGCIIGVGDMARSVSFYREVLGYDKTVYDVQGTFEDLEGLAGAACKLRRVLLTHSAPRRGAFSRLLGSSQVELVQSCAGSGNRLFEHRDWGDLGFIHLCFDVTGMTHIKSICERHAHPFTVDSGESFTMGEAQGRFSYVEDPDATLIEFVETYRLPIAKRLHWRLDLRKRDPSRPLPDWLLKALALNRVRE